MADIPIDEAEGQDWDLIVSLYDSRRDYHYFCFNSCTIIAQALPGGMPGAEHLRDNGTLISMLKRQKDAGKLYGAICASPAVVLASHNLVGAGATCFPAEGLRSKMDVPVDERVVVQGNCVTSQGPGTALAFGVKLGEILYGEEKAKSVAGALLI